MGKVRYSSKVSDSMRKMIAPNNELNGRASIGNEDKVGEYFYISVDRLKPYSDQARVRFDPKELEELKKSIDSCGVLQPLQIMSSSDDKYEVISGERRLRAAKLCGLAKVPCIIVKNKDKSGEIAIVENIQRSDLHPLELAKAYSDLLKIKKSQVEVARSLGVSPQSVSDTLKFLEIPEDIQKDLIQKNIRSRDALRRIIKQKTVSNMSSSKSVLRVALSDEGFKIQKQNIDYLSKEQKDALVRELKEIISFLNL